MHSRILGRRLGRIALIDDDEFDTLARHRLYPHGQLGDLRPILIVGGDDEEHQRVAQSIDHDVRLAALAPLRPVVTRAGAGFRRRW